MAAQQQGGRLCTYTHIVTKKYDQSIRLVALSNIAACGVCKFDEGLGLNAPRPHVRAQAKFYFCLKKAMSSRDWAWLQKGLTKTLMNSGVHLLGGTKLFRKETPLHKTYARNRQHVNIFDFLLVWIFVVCGAQSVTWVL